MTFEELIAKVGQSPALANTSSGSPFTVSKIATVVLHELGIEIRESDGAVMIGTKALEMTSQHREWQPPGPSPRRLSARARSGYRRRK